ncbi:MAG: hypothetical protein ACI4Q8_07795 [Ruminococcus sp.]
MIIDNEGRADRFIYKITPVPDRICNNPSVGFADTSLYTREAFCVRFSHSLYTREAYPKYQFHFLALRIFLTNCKALSSIFLLEVAELPYAFARTSTDLWRIEGLQG